MQKVLPARRASYASIFIETSFRTEDGEFQDVGRGTGFLKQVHGAPFLVTNWHVVTGRDPVDPANTLPDVQTSPTHQKIYLATKSNPEHFVPLGPVALYDTNGNANWAESSLGPARADVVAVPVSLPEDAITVFVDEFMANGAKALQPGLDVVIIGFPFYPDRHAFPIWKRAMIASEPAYTIEGKPMVYLDTPGRPGMSGSPVYFLSDGFLASKKTVRAIESLSAADAILDIEPSDLLRQTANLEFAGIYAGSLGDRDLEQLNLGRFFPRYHFDEIERNGRVGSNPYPPKFF